MITIIFNETEGEHPTEVLASQITSEQLCDIIQEWLDGDSYVYSGDFENNLQDLLVKEGRY